MCETRVGKSSVCILQLPTTKTTQSDLSFAEFVVICTISLICLKSNGQIPFERILSVTKICSNGFWLFVLFVLFDLSSYEFCKTQLYCFKKYEGSCCMLPFLGRHSFILRGSSVTYARMFALPGWKFWIHLWHLHESVTIFSHMKLLFFKILTEFLFLSQILKQISYKLEQDIKMHT